MKSSNGFKMNILRGGIYLVDLRNRVGFDQGDICPVLVMQNDKGKNMFLVILMCSF